MVCNTYTLSSNADFLSIMNDRVCRDRIPLCGSIDLTSRCNLSCIHCYISGQGLSDLLSTEKIISCIDEAAEAGCLFLLLTGGEPLLRSDFKTIYEHAKRAGLLVSLFTNATLIDEKMSDFLADLPPHVVEISIYGATASVHDRITGVEGSFEKTMRGCMLLRDSGVDVTLKTILMTLNRDELGGMMDMASVRGLKFRVDGAIFPRLDGDKSPLKLRLSPVDVVDREFMIPNRAEHWLEFLGRVGEVKSSDSLYDCGAGINCFHVTSDGHLKPCIMASEPSYDLTKSVFSDVWLDMAVISDRKVEPDYPCSNCDKRLICDSCPGFFGLEMGDEGVYSEYVCAIAGERAKVLDNYRAESQRC